MSKTTNYDLYLCDDDTKRFQDWRKEINGTNDSNMIKIDTALGEKADSSVAVTGTLAASAWSGVNSPYTQTIVVEGLGASQNGSISLAHNATTAQREAAREALLSVVGQAEDSITVVADGEMPDVDIPVLIVLFG